MKDKGPKVGDKSKKKKKKSKEEESRVSGSEL